MTIVRASMQMLHHSLEFIRCIGLTLDYLFIDSYRYEQIFRLFIEVNPQLTNLIVKIVASHQKFNALARCYSKNKEVETRCHAPLVACKLLFKILTNQCEVGKSMFLNESDAGQGVTTLKTFINTFRENPASYESYLYCLGMIPSLLTLS